MRLPEHALPATGWPYDPPHRARSATPPNTSCAIAVCNCPRTHRYTIYKDHITLEDYEIHDGMGLELYYN